MSACPGCGFINPHHQPDCPKMAAHDRATLRAASESVDPDATPSMISSDQPIPDDKRKIFEETIANSPTLQLIIAERIAEAVADAADDKPRADAIVVQARPKEPDPLRSIHEGGPGEPLCRIATALELIAKLMGDYAYTWGT